MGFLGAISKIMFQDGPMIIFGLNDTRAEVANEYPHAPIGTIYIHSPTSGSTGRMYLKVTHSGAAQSTDWQKITSAASD